MSNHVSSLAYAYGKPASTACFKKTPADFIVYEELSFKPSGEGEHFFLHIEKTNLNTLDVCERVAKYFRVHPRNIAYAGLKDKNAITSQWFSFPYPIKLTPNIDDFNSESIKVIDGIRNNKKLKRGAIQRNCFKIILHDFIGDIADIKNRINLIINNGVPNYFTAQRFGHNEKNLEYAKKLFSGEMKFSRNKKSIYLSAARSFLFNNIVSKRVNEDMWNIPIEGDLAVLNNTRSFFAIDNNIADVSKRIKQGDIHLSAPLWGEGSSLAVGQAGILEQSVIDQSPEISKGLVKEGLRQDRRAMRLIPMNFEFEFAEDLLSLSFCLPSGSYATSILRELVL